MKQIAVIFLGLFGSLVLLEGCKKYPEGPAISLRSKKERVANTWKLDALISGGVDSTAYFTGFFNDYTVILTKSGSYTISYSFRGFSATETGGWAFASGKEDLQITPKTVSYGSLPAPSVFQIMKLYEKNYGSAHSTGTALPKNIIFRLSN